MEPQLSRREVWIAHFAPREALMVGGEIKEHGLHCSAQLVLPGEGLKIHCQD